jgi:hypothetical protein
VLVRTRLQDLALFLAAFAMSAIFREAHRLSRQGRQNAIDLFTGQSREEILNQNGNKIIVANSSIRPSNPFEELRRISKMEWNFFLCGLFAFFADMLDFYSLAIQTTKIALYWQSDKVWHSIARKAVIESTNSPLLLPRRQQSHRPSHIQCSFAGWVLLYLA